QRVEPTACLVAVPATIVKELHRTAGIDDHSDEPLPLPRPTVQSNSNDLSWLQLLKADKKLWQPQLAYIIARHATHLNRWQLGADGSDAFVTMPQMRQVYDKIYSEFANLIETPDLAMPWPAWYELDG